MRLDDLPTGQPARVVAVRAPAETAGWARALADIGFTTGESVRVMRRAALGGDPLVVRIGVGTFALRRAEASCVSVEPQA